MLPYWIIYLIPALLMFSELGRRRLHLTITFWLALGLFFAFFIGFRYEVGGDWGSYLKQYETVAGMPLIMGLALGNDPGYVFLNWLMAKLGLGIYGVNFLCGAIFVTGLIVYCRQQANPLLAFAVAVPYLVIVVAMGYTRQGVALGLLFWAIAYLERDKFIHYIALIAVGALFHKTVLIMLPFGFLISGGAGKWIKVGVILLAGYGLWNALFAQVQEALWTNYVDAEMVSQGAKIRVFMNVLPSLLLLIYWKRWKQSIPNHWFWFWLAVGSLVAFGIVDYASTAVDRMALYFAPIQLAIYSRLVHLPLLPGQRQLDPDMLTAAVVLGYAVVLYVWLNYASHAHYWVPYQNIIFL